MFEVLVVEADGTRKMHVEIPSKTTGRLTWEVQNPDFYPNEETFSDLVNLVRDYVSNEQ